MFRISVLTLALGVLAAPPAAAEGKLYAVLVGVKEYDHSGLKPLAYTENDVTALGTVLKKHNFAVTLLTDSADADHKPTRANILKRMETVLDGCKRDDIVLLAFSGHGLQFDQERASYFCPSDANPTKPETLLSLNELYKQLGASGAGIKLLLVDACRDDPSAGRGARGLDGNTVPRPPRGVAALFSCSAGQRAFEHDKLKHGIFFHYVLEGLRGKAKNAKGEVTWDSLQAYVRSEVPDQVEELVGGGAKQTPSLTTGELAGEPPVLARLAPGGVLNPGGPTSTAIGTRYRGARDLFRQESYSKSVEEFDDLLKIAPTHLSGRCYRAAAIGLAGNTQDSIKELTKILGQNPQSSLALALRGRVRAAAQDFDAALKDCDEAVKLAPRSALALQWRGEVHALRKDHDKALADYTEALKISPRERDALLKRGLVHYARESYDAAIKDFGECLKLDPTDRAALENRGRAHYHKRDFDKAIADFDEMIKRDGSRWDGYALRGYANELKGDNEQAIQDYTRALSRKTDAAWVYTNRAKVYEKLGKSREAAADRARAKQLVARN